MKKNMIIMSLLILVLALSCNMDTPVDEETDLWSDSPAVSSNLDLNNTAPAPSSSIISRSIARTAVDTNKIYFRSSDIEFWSISEENDLNSIFSSLYQEDEGGNIVSDALGYDKGQSLAYDMGDETESIVFYPYTNYTASIGNGLNENWDTYTSDFIDAGNTQINLARLDVGAGAITFIINGETKQVLNSKGESSCFFTLEELEEYYADDTIEMIDTIEEYNYWLNFYNTFSGADMNSIFFVDRQFLSEPVLCERDTQEQILNDEVIASDFNISDTEFSFIKTLFQNNNYDDPVTMIDVDGALFIPLEPVDISGFNPAENTLQIEVSWDIANAIHLRNGEYFMDNRVGNTSFNFEVALTIQDK